MPRKNTLKPFLLCTLGLLIAVPVCLLAQTPDRKPITRTKKPKFERRETDGIYFDNVFEDALMGERPANLGSKPAKMAAGGSGEDTGTTAEVDVTFPWSKLISSTSIEDEVKALKINLDKTVTTPNKFASGGSKVARVDYSMLAVLFAIIHEYDGEVKWKSDASAARDAFARCADNASTSSQIAFQQAKTRNLDLAEILRSGSPSFDPAEEPANDWERICDRSPLMDRLETAYGDVLKPGTASASEFKSKIDEIKQEANIVAAIGEVLTKEGMEDSIEDEYAEYAHAMKKAAVDLQEAIKLDSLEQASKAVGAIGQSCTKCHDDWQ